MKKEKVDMFIGFNSENFHQQDLITIKEKLLKIDDDKFFLIQGAEFQKPSIILLIAIFLGWERFWLDDIGLGFLKIITLQGLLLWWLIDMFTAKDRAKEYNFKKFMKIV